jgi:hypothetical protein
MIGIVALFWCFFFVISIVFAIDVDHGVSSRRHTVVISSAFADSRSMHICALIDMIYILSKWRTDWCNTAYMILDVSTLDLTFVRLQNRGRVCRNQVVAVYARRRHALHALADMVYVPLKDGRYYVFFLCVWRLALASHNVCLWGGNSWTCMGWLLDGDPVLRLEVNQFTSWTNASDKLRTSCRRAEWLTTHGMATPCWTLFLCLTL